MHRRFEIAEAVREWQKRGKVCVLATVALPHADYEDDPRELLPCTLGWFEEARKLANRPGPEGANLAGGQHRPRHPGHRGHVPPAAGRAYPHPLAAVP